MRHRCFGWEIKVRREKQVVDKPDQLDATPTICDTSVILRCLTNFILLTNGRGLIGTPYLARDDP